MNYRITMDQLKGLVGPELGLLALVLVALIAWYVLDNKTGAAEESLAKELQELKAAQDDLSYWTKNFDQLELLQDLEAARAAEPPPDLPTRRDAAGFRDRFLAYAGANRLPLSTLEVEEVRRNVGEARFPAVRYSVALSGPLQPLIDSLQLLDQYPTATVDELEYFQADPEGTVWAMTLSLDVLYEEVADGS